MVTATAMVSRVRVVLAFFRAVRIYSLRDRVAVDAEGFGGVGNALLVSVEGLLNVELFELGDGLIQCNVAVEHVVDYCF
jgi:hypothetical protein